ncbi:hypothetical protein A4H97_29780 [Niastella yeongjuensis]|uniref:Uncharacterized protein n=1 Tax=Niastella yeongjuensis TaxID=354355 RepID=A0A1V9EPF8_9BACT|nr:hypothetical protein [Niastella yeongjuensis]OQP48029.1 hypothetical protein A4H97_29780 [Niastella yeongjuensis]SEO24149.1 hypothetical protein SAMN05660816_02356 [Niastella yeongjuensis]
MKVSSALAGGLAGTLTVASLHEAMRRISPTAPRMDLLDMDLLRKGLTKMHRKVPADGQLQRWAVGGELLCDTAYFSMAAAGGRKKVWLCGALLGLAAGISAVVLPKSMGLPTEPSNKTVATKFMTIGLYFLGGLAAAAVAQLVDRTDKKNEYIEDVYE